LDAGDTAKYVNQLRYFQKKIEDSLDEVGLKVVNLEGQVFDAGMAVSAINIEDFEARDVLVVEQMIEPVIMGGEGLKRSGVVMVRKV
jgi:molecular chaperone GrpE (heat shock protein)